MYQPTSNDIQVLRDRARQLGAQLARHQQGRLSDDELRPLRLQNGLYIQRHAPMLRIAIAYGMLRADQLRCLADVAQRFDRSYGHWTTRQNMQLNWIEVEDVPQALEMLAEVGLHGIQSSGNCLRNITSDAFAGIAPDELFDPRPYAELLRQWSSFHPELSFLPRKFKVAFTATSEDRALVQIHDLAFEAITAEPKASFRVRIGGGLGRTPILGPVVRESLPWDDLLCYTHAVMRVYNELGRRDNLTKARIKILVRSVGVETFRDMVEAEFKSLKQAGIDRVRIEDLDRVRAQFLDPDWRLASVSTDLVQSSNDPLFARWLRRNSKPHKIPGMAAIVVPIKGTGRPPGDITSDEMRKLADLADRFSQGFLRVTHSQDLVFPAVPSAKLAELYEALQPIGFAQPIQGLIGDMVACPGGDFCALANARSLPIADEIANRYANLDEQENLGPLELKISGCMNSCGHHHIGHIGILGVDKDGAAFYQLLLGGHSGHGDRASLGKIVGRAFSEAEIPDAVEAILDEYLESRLRGETFHQALQRLGPAVFIEAANAVRQKVSPPSMAASTLEQA